MVLSRRGRRRATARPAGAIGLVLLAVAAVACASDDTDDTVDTVDTDDIVDTVDTDGGGAATADGPTVVATTGIWADITRMVACDGAAEVRQLVPTGADPHAYEPSLDDRTTLDGADLVVANGHGVEGLVDDTLADVEDGGVAVFRAADRAGIDASTDAGDPHVWFDPLLVRDLVPALGDAVVAAGGDRTAVEGCVADARQQLSELDAELRAVLADVPADRRTLVTNHDALGWFASRYDFAVLGAVLPSSSTLAEPSPAELDELAAVIEDAGVPAIFTEHHEAGADAEALAERAGVALVPLYTDSLGEEEATTYPDLLRYDASAIAAALAGDRG